MLAADRADARVPRGFVERVGMRSRTHQRHSPLVPSVVPHGSARFTDVRA